MWTKINNVNSGEGEFRKVCYRNIDHHSKYILLLLLRHNSFHVFIVHLCKLKLMI